MYAGSEPAKPNQRRNGGIIKGLGIDVGLTGMWIIKWLHFESQGYVGDYGIEGRKKRSCRGAGREFIHCV